ncbi:DUF397 domain-containing protein [Actinocorallia libanotica]|uniref:DUF397 domain-containing protein n=1 Tax=Actinocorallia libanotica TaxID=46162 RepID=A0ABN1QCX7_9ACTN
MIVTDLSTMSWRKSTYSDSEGGACVELAGVATTVAVRDSKNPEWAALLFGRAAFGALVQVLKAKTVL